MTSTPIDIEASTTAEIADAEPIIPEPIEYLFRDRGLKVLYWNVGEPFRINEEDPNTALFAPLTVLFSNGKRAFRSVAEMNLDVLYGLVGTDEVDQAMLEAATDLLLEASHEVPQVIVDIAEEDETYARSISLWTHTDGDLIRAAAADAPEAWGELLEVVAPIVDGIEPGQSYATPEAQLAAVAMKIAWDLL